MRLDLFLKVSRLVKRRVVAAELCSTARVLVNDNVAKPGKEIRQGDIITLKFSTRTVVLEVVEILSAPGKTRPGEMYLLKSVMPTEKDELLWNENRS